MQRCCTHCIPRLYDFRAAKCLSKERLRKLRDLIMRRLFRQFTRVVAHQYQRVRPRQVEIGKRDARPF